MQLDVMDGFGSGMMGYGSWILWVLILIPVIIGLAVLIWYLWQGGKREKESALEILKKRHARGEITQEQYHEMEKNLTG